LGQRGIPLDATRRNPRVPQQDEQLTATTSEVENRWEGRQVGQPVVEASTNLFLCAAKGVDQEGLDPRQLGDTDFVLQRHGWRGQGLVTEDALEEAADLVNLLGQPVEDRVGSADDGRDDPVPESHNVTGRISELIFEPIEALVDSCEPSRAQLLDRGLQSALP
jgi:hypothetical protein